MKQINYKALSVMLIAGLLLFGFNNCRPVHTGPQASFNSLSSYGFCGEDLEYAYIETFYKLMKEKSNCASCHSTNYTDKDASHNAIADDDTGLAVLDFFNDNNPFTQSVADHMTGQHGEYIVTAVPALDIAKAQSDFESAYSDFQSCIE